MQMKVKVKVTQLCLTLQDPMDCPWYSLAQNTGVNSLSFLQEILPTQESNSGCPHCRWFVYQLSYQGSLRILEWVAYPFSSGSSRPNIETGSPALPVDSLPTELPGKPDWSLPGSSVHGILQARILEWVAMPSSRVSFRPRD